MRSRPVVGPRSAPAAFQRRSLFSRPGIPPAGVHLTRRHRRFTCVHPSGLPQPVTPGRNRGPWAFPRASHPAVTRSARQGGDGPCTLDRELRHRHKPVLLLRVPLTPVRSARGALQVLPPVGFPSRLPHPACASQRTGRSTSPVGPVPTSCCARPWCRDLCSPVVVAPGADSGRVEQFHATIAGPDAVASA